MHRGVSDEQNQDATDEYINVKPCEYEPSPFDLFQNDVYNSKGISDTTAFDKISGYTCQRTGDNISGETLDSSIKSVQDPDKSQPSTSQLNFLSDESYSRSIEMRLFEDLEETDISYELMNKKTKFSKRDNIKSGEKIKIRKKNEKLNSKMKKEKQDFENWANSFNEHCKEIEAYQLCIE